MINQKIFVGTDMAVFRKENDSAMLLLIQRKNEPFKNMWCLPGGFVEDEETPHDAAIRELKEETGLEISEATQLHVFGRVDRDPRFRVISIAHIAQLPAGHPHEVKGGDDAAAAKWYDLNALPPLGFDHAEIIRLAKERARALGWI